PTAEEMSRDIFNRLKDMGLSVYEVELFETPNNSCIYSE
ncbi:6-carboxytetrahydropterin synthase, partial [Clostridium sp. IBUN13A]